MTTETSTYEQKIRTAARNAGITLTPSGEPLFARDLARYIEIRASVDARSAEQIATDAAEDAYEASH